MFQVQHIITAEVSVSTGGSKPRTHTTHNISRTVTTVGQKLLRLWFSYISKLKYWNNKLLRSRISPPTHSFYNSATVLFPASGGRLEEFSIIFDCMCPKSAEPRFSPSGSTLFHIWCATLATNCDKHPYILRSWNWFPRELDVDGDIKYQE